MKSFNSIGKVHLPADRMRSLTAHIKASLLLGICLFVQSATAESTRLSIGGWNKTTIYHWVTDRCADADTPDAPARAFRDYRGSLHLFATHDDNRAFTGPDFEHLRHSCSVVYVGRHSDSPADFSDRIWLVSFSTPDGKHIFALGHDEFHGHLRRQICPSGSYMSCWENAITLAISDDGGYRFAEPQSSRSLVASIPYTYQSDVGHPIGYFQPSNMVQKSGFYYILFHAEAFGAQKRGACVARSGDLRDPLSWRAWNGRAYEVSFVDPYSNVAFNEADHVCAVVGQGHLFDISSLFYDAKTQLFFALSSVPDGNGNASIPPGAYLTSSTDLVTWSQPTLVVSEADLRSHDNVKDNGYGFFSIIDEASESFDFSTVSEHPNLFLYYVEMNHLRPPYSRDLVKLPLKIEHFQ